MVDRFNSGFTPKYGASYRPGLYPLPRDPAPIAAPAKPLPPPPEPVPDPEPAPIPVATPTAHSYADFRALLNGRRMQLGLSMEELDHIAAFPSGYSSKLLVSNYKKHDQQRNLGPGSLNKMLDALVVGVRLVPGVPGSDDLPREIDTCAQLALLRERGRKGHAAWMAKTNPRKRIEWARKAARARWGRSSSSGKR